MPSRLGLLGAALIATLAATLAPGTAFAGHIACGDVITKDTRLDSDLLACPGDGLVVGADDVTIDLAGHRIQGSAPCEGVRAVGRRGFTVRNGVVEGFASGLHLDAATDGRLRGLVVRSNGTGIRLIGSNSSVAGTTVEDNSAGILVAGAGNEVVGSTVTTTLFSGPPPYAPAPVGIRLEAATETQIDRNRVAGYYHSIVLDRSRRNHVTRNALELGHPLLPVGGVPLMGVYANQGSDNRLARNFVSGATYALYVSEPGARIEANVAVRNRYGVLTLGEAREIVVRGNLVADNLENGIDLSAPASLIERNVALRNRIGIRASVLSIGTLVVQNRVSGNRSVGIDANAGTAVKRNMANRNGELGIYGDAGVIDGGGNKAWGNGDPLQCVGIVCK